MWLCMCMCESTERGVLWERALLFHVFQPFRPLDSLCLCSVSAAASVADDDVVIWPCIKCSFVATIVVVACHLLSFLVFGGPLEGLCVCVNVWGAAGNHNYTRNGAHKNTSNTHIHSACVHVFVLAACTNRAVAPVCLIQFSYSPACTHTQRHLARSFAPTHTHSQRAQETEGERENAAPDEESLIRQAAIAVVVHNSPQSPPLPWLSAGNRS